MSWDHIGKKYSHFIHVFFCMPATQIILPGMEFVFIFNKLMA